MALVLQTSALCGWNLWGRMYPVNGRGARPHWRRPMTAPTHPSRQALWSGIKDRKFAMFTTPSTPTVICIRGR